MAKNLTIDDKYKILQENNPLAGQGSELLKKILIGAGLTGGASYLLSDTDTREDPKVRRKRILRNTLLGTALGAGVGGGLSIGAEYMNHAIPVLKDVTAGESGGQSGFLGRNYGKLLLGATGGTIGHIADKRKTTRALEVIREAIGNGKVMAKGTTLRDLAHAAKARTEAGSAVRGVLSNPGKSRILGKAIKRLGFGKGTALTKLLGRHKGLSLLAAAGIAAPSIARKVGPSISRWALGSDDLDL